MPKLDGKPIAAKLTRADTRAMMCDGKERFTRHRLAMRCAQRAGKRERVKMSVYLCRFCKGYHVGVDSRPKPKSSRFDPLTPEEDWELVQIQKLNRMNRK